MSKLNCDKCHVALLGIETFYDVRTKHRGSETLCKHCYELLITEALAESKSKHDPVNHPSHYVSHPSGVECITITRHHTFNIGNVIKYLWRAGIKDDTKQIEDLKKARFYLTDEIKRLGGDVE